MAGTGTPPREKARVYRTGRPDRLCSLLFAVAALILCAGIGAVLWHEWQGTRPTAAEQAEADEIERADGGEEEIAAVTEEAADGKIVVAIDPGHGGVNPSVGGEDAAKTAISFGATNFAVGSALGWLDTFFTLKKPDYINITADFASEETKIDCYCEIKLVLAAGIAFFFTFLGRAIKYFFTHDRARASIRHLV